MLLLPCGMTLVSAAKRRYKKSRVWCTGVEINHTGVAWRYSYVQDIMSVTIHHVTEDH